MKVVRSDEVDDPSAFYKITACRKCGKERMVARESGICQKCGMKWMQSFFQYLANL